MLKTNHRRALTWLMLMALAGLPIFYFSYVKRGTQLDDALIYLRYVRNCLDGHGLVYNTGEKFNGLTSPLFTCLVLLMAWILKDLQATVIIVSTACFWIFAVVMARICWRGNVLYQMLMVVVIGLTPPFIYETYGMESTLLIMLSALLLWAYQARRLFWCSVCAGLLCITRAEGGLLPLVVLFDYWLQNRRLPHSAYFIAPIALVGASYGFNYCYYGHVLPDSITAKLGQGKSGLWGSGWLFLNSCGYLKGRAFHADSLYMIVCFGCALLGLWQFRRSMLTRVAVPYVLAYVAGCAAAGVPNYHWYYTPVFAFGSVYAALGVLGLLQRRHGRISPWPGVPVAAVLGAYLVCMGCLYSNQPARPREAYRQIGMWIKQNTAPAASIAMVEIGTIGWYSDRHIIDILGLVTPLNAEFIAEKKFCEWLSHYSPDYILLHEPLWSHEQSARDPRIVKGYRPDAGFRFRGYTLLKKIQSL